MSDKNKMMNNPKKESQRRTAIKKILFATTGLSMADGLAINLQKTENNKIALLYLDNRL